MKFELSPDNRDQPDGVLLEDLRSVAAKLNGQLLTRTRYDSHGRFAGSTIAKRFGGWAKALEKAGLEPPRYNRIAREECLADLNRVARELGTDTLTVALYERHGRYSVGPFERHFGGWVQAFKVAGLKISEQYHERISNEELFDNLEIVWQSVGRQPVTSDFVPPISRYSHDVYKRRFGGFRKALEAFVAAAQEAPTEDEQNVEPAQIPANSINGAPIKRASRSIGWRLRYIVLKRDRFSCRSCGQSPAITVGTVLQVDHIFPWSKGGKTDETNLQTLCERCNIGKGAA